MRPHTKNLYNMLLLQDLVGKPMLNVDATGDSTLQITNQRFVWRRHSKRIRRKDVERPFGISRKPNAESHLASFWACLV